MGGNHLAGRTLGLGTADMLVHHVHAFTVHVTTLVLLKGCLLARGSRLVPDKARLGFRFPCDGPGRGGTCQVSAWDHVFLGLFWMYNAISVVVFHCSWKLQTVLRIAHQCIRPSLLGSAFRVGILVDVPVLGSRLLARAYRIHYLGSSGRHHSTSNISQGVIHHSR